MSNEQDNTAELRREERRKQRAARRAERHGDVAPKQTDGTDTLFNLLVIDDEVDMIKALERQFRRHYNVHIANSADEGYQIMCEHPVQVIISDQRMPGMTGTEFYEKVMGEFPDAIRLLLTGYADINAVIQAINDGQIFRYITKPWDPTELDTIVREAFERYTLIIKNRNLLKELKEANATLEQRVQERTSELVAANQELVQVNALKDEFLGIAAHDLRAPLSAVLGFVHLLRGKLKFTEERRNKFMERIQAVTENMLELLNDLLDFNKIERGKIEITPQTVDISEYVEQIRDIYGQLGEQKDIALEIELAPDITTAKFDPMRIEQVLNNLLSNAFKFSHENTKVTLSVARKDDRLEFIVQDQGQGIKPEEIEHIFGAFQRTSTRATQGEHGAGLGLAICQKIVEAHNGTIDVQSVPGEGSRFAFRLPLEH